MKSLRTCGRAIRWKRAGGHEDVGHGVSFAVAAAVVAPTLAFVVSLVAFVLILDSPFTWA